MRMLPWIYWCAHLKCDSIYKKRISADCIAYGTEETTRSGKITRWNPVEDKWELYKPPAKQVADSGDLFRTQVAPAVAGAIPISYR